jgi:hypothetical protein
MGPRVLCYTWPILVLARAHDAFKSIIGWKRISEQYYKGRGVLLRGCVRLSSPVPCKLLLESSLPAFAWTLLTFVVKGSPLLLHVFISTINQISLAEHYVVDSPANLSAIKLFC